MKKVDLLVLAVLCFFVRYRVTESTECQKLKAVTNATILSYTSSEKKNGLIRCWLLNSTNGTTMNVTVVESSVGTGKDCQNENVTIEGVTVSKGWTAVKAWCGTETPSYQSSGKRGNELKITFFNSDNGLTKKFKLRYRAMIRCNVTTNPPKMIEVNVSDNVVLSCTSACPSPVRYSWIHNNVVISRDRETGHLAVPHVSDADFGYYTCIASQYADDDHDVGYSGSNYIEVRVIYGPLSVKLISTDGTYVQGQSTDLRCEARCYPPCQYKWTFREKTLNNSDYFSLHILGGLHFKSLSSDDAGEYTCIATNPKTLKTGSKSITISVSNTENTENADMLTIIIGVAVGAVVLLMKIIIVIVVIIRKAATKKSEQPN